MVDVRFELEEVWDLKWHLNIDGQKGANKYFLRHVCPFLFI